MHTQSQFVFLRVRHVFMTFVEPFDPVVDFITIRCLDILQFTHGYYVSCYRYSEKGKIGKF